MTLLAPCSGTHILSATFERPGHCPGFSCLRCNPPALCILRCGCPGLVHVARHRAQKRLPECRSVAREGIVFAHPATGYAKGVPLARNPFFVTATSAGPLT